MSDPLIDPSLARQEATTTDFVTDHQHLHQPQGVPANDIFGAYEHGPDPSAYQQLVAPQVHVEEPDTAVAAGEKKKTGKGKKAGPLVRKRSGWNAFYKEQFAIYHANNPPETKQNARERKGFASYAAAMWKQLSPAQKNQYVQRASEDDALAVSKPVEKLRRKRASLLDTLGRIVAELETEFGVESLVFWAEKNPPGIDENGLVAAMVEGEAYGIVGSSTGSKYIELLSNGRLGPHTFTAFVQQTVPEQTDENTNLLIAARKRKHSETALAEGEASGISMDELDPALKRKPKSNISRDYHDAEFRRLLLTLLNSTLPPQAHKTRLPRGFFGPYLGKHGLELVGLPERPTELQEGGKIGGWSADALRRNLEAVRAGKVYIRRIGQDGPVGQLSHDHIADFTVETMEEEAEDGGEGVGEEEEAAMILAEGNRRGRSAQK